MLHLQPLNDGMFQWKVCLDTAVNMAEWFYDGHYERCHTDMRVFKPLAPSNSELPFNLCYRNHKLSNQDESQSWKWSIALSHLYIMFSWVEKLMYFTKD